MAKEKFGVAVDEGIVREVDELVAECDDLGASRSEIVEAILTAFVQSETDHVERVRKIGSVVSLDGDAATALLP
jgi:metal-responsive CopG/Arc/MetJ family transcriptional regulator